MVRRKVETWTRAGNGSLAGKGFASGPRGVEHSERDEAEKMREWSLNCRAAR